ncbi:MAG: isoamylase early set domain-containing protein [Candidatus Omnitrophica bacterium]|nr:isoamylase early set domain-containing protein [Candidatus Omnitrophota bacterium]
MGEFDKFKPKPKNKLETNTLFEFYAPSAEDVRLAGTFNHWDPSKYRLKKNPDGRWHLNLKLKPGRYEYRYMVDGNWENDQRPVQCVPNAFGTWNCVVEVS